MDVILDRSLMVDQDSSETIDQDSDTDRDRSET
ncbi:unnamed protein product, partial [Rotaria magnacalcarata]